MYQKSNEEVLCCYRKITHASASPPPPSVSSSVSFSVYLKYILKFHTRHSRPSGPQHRCPSSHTLAHWWSRGLFKCSAVVIEIISHTTKISLYYSADSLLGVPTTGYHGNNHLTTKEKQPALFTTYNVRSTVFWSVKHRVNVKLNFSVLRPKWTRPHVDADGRWKQKISKHFVALTRCAWDTNVA